MQRMSRRKLMQATAIGAVATSVVSKQCLAEQQNHGQAKRESQKVRYCLNTSTIRGQKLSIVKQIEVTAQAGYDGIEIWLRDVEEFISSGGKLIELRKRLADSGLVVESAIAFANWIVEDPSLRRKAMEQAAKDMDLLRRLGGHRIAAPPAGARDSAKIELDNVADRYRALCQLGRKIDVVPQLEVWGFSTNLSTLKDVLYVLAASQHPDACLLPDIYHLYKGGSNFTDLALVNPNKIHVLHLNDYPGAIERKRITDADRVYPTDGDAPLPAILNGLLNSGFRGVVSLELFNPIYWRQPASEVASTGLAKMKKAIELVNDRQPSCDVE